MKQGTLKTLGAAALGAAFAVAAAGSASAVAPADATDALNSLPIGKAAKTVSGVTKSKLGDNDLHVQPNTGGVHAAPKTGGNEASLGGLPLGSALNGLGGA